MIGSIVTVIVSCVASNIMVFLLFPQERKSKIIENEAKQSEEWRKLYNEEREERSRLNTKIDDLYVQVNLLRNEIADKSDEVSKLSTENAQLKVLKCTKPGCPNRQPPSNY